MLLEKFTSRPVEDILIDLFALKLRERNGEKIEQPLITLFLGGNRFPVAGFLTDMKNEPKEKGVVIKFQNSNDILFVDLYAVAGITISDADKAAHLLVELTADDLSSFPTVTKLDVKKQLADETAKLTAEFGPMSIALEEDPPTNASEFFFTKLFLSDISSSLIAISKMDGGKQAIQEEVKGVKIKRGADLAVNKEETTLVIHYPFNKSFTTNKNRNVLVDLIYNIL